MYTPPFLDQVDYTVVVVVIVGTLSISIDHIPHSVRRIRKNLR
ncbi:MAG: hypothetical protein ACI90V_013122, partial [Bacillariaceae sp.]